MKEYEAMVKKTTVWASVPTRCPHCGGRLRVYAREEIIVTKRSGYIRKPIKSKKSKRKS